MPRNQKKKKYWVSGSVSSILFTLPLIDIVFPFLVWSTDYEFPTDVVVICAAYTAICLFAVLFIPECGKFSVDEKGITTHTLLRTSFIPWEDVSECGYISMKIGKTHLYLSIFFSTQILSKKQRKWFFQTTQMNMKNVAYFFYDKEMVAEVCSQVPPNIAKQIQHQEQMILPYIKEYEAKAEEYEKRQWWNK